MLLRFKKRKKKKRSEYFVHCYKMDGVYYRQRERERERGGGRERHYERYLIKNKIINFLVFKQTKKPMKKGRSTERKEQKIKEHTKKTKKI